MNIFETVDDMQAWSIKHEREGAKIAFVPTMGYLHQGHLTLVREAHKRGDLVVVSIFVNPIQFGPNEDLCSYPQDFEHDRDLLEQEGIAVIFHPSAEEMYKPERRTSISVSGMDEKLCGASRPGHFTGVCTVVLKLFEIVRPSVAVFGWKDAQQLLILRRMASDLNLAVELVGVETVREPDGLACSSRNKYLTENERRNAVVLYNALQHARLEIEKNEVIDPSELRTAMIEMIDETEGADIDYCEIVSKKTLEPIKQIEPGNTLIALAVRFGRTRLIDNIRL